MNPVRFNGNLELMKYLQKELNEFWIGPPLLYRINNNNNNNIIDVSQIKDSYYLP